MPTITLKQLIINVMSAVQDIGLQVVTTVCDQESTNTTALASLCADNRSNNSSYHFSVNNQTVFVIFDVPHLLKNTRNCLLRCRILSDSNKYGQKAHIQQAFNLDQETRTYKQLKTLLKKHFNFQGT